MSIFIRLASIIRYGFTPFPLPKGKGKKSDVSALLLLFDVPEPAPLTTGNLALFHPHGLALVTQCFEGRLGKELVQLFICLMPDCLRNASGVAFTRFLFTISLINLFYITG